MSAIALAARALLGVVFAVAGAAKLADLKGSRSALEAFGVPRRLASVGGVALPVFELAVAVGLLVPATAWWSALGAVALLLLFVAAIALSLARGREPDCHCFGQVHSAPAGPSTLLRNIGLLALAGVVVAAGRDEMLSPIAWAGELSAVEAVFGAIALALIVVAVAQAVFLLQLLRQNGRILSRLESLEAQPGPGLSNGALRAESSGNGGGGIQGLAVGVSAPEFELPSLDGGQVSLERLRSRGLPVLLVFSDPACGPCNTMLPDVGTWQRDHAERLTVALVSRGTNEQNAAKAGEHDLSDVLLQQDRETAIAYRLSGTPGAVLISVDGRIASPLVFGPEAIASLVENVTAVSSTPDATAPSGLQVGAEAPELEWEDLNRRTIALRELHGTRVTLIFWNPRCGFCQSIAPELKAWQESHRVDEHHAIVISSGTAAENRALDLQLPIVLEDRFSTGPIFGVNGTPSAVAIDANGRVAAPPAIGGPALLDLLSHSSPQ
ncbi:MAG TPA: MauE/DoxX family redox-associated membrane protein [Solirubrobacterales bacterium]